MDKKNRRSQCPVACSLDIIGDKWTMIIIRDLFLGSHKYADFLKSPEKITTNILATRLKKLEKENLIFKKSYQNNPIRYEYFLTKKGEDLKPLMMAMVEWGCKYENGVIKKI